MNWTTVFILKRKDCCRLNLGWTFEKLCSIKYLGFIYSCELYCILYEQKSVAQYSCKQNSAELIFVFNRSIYIFGIFYRKTIENHGGIYSPSLDMESTMLVVLSKPEGDKYKYAKKWKIPCVSSNWVFDSVEKGYCLPTANYRWVQGRLCQLIMKVGLWCSYVGTAKSLRFWSPEKIEQVFIFKVRISLQILLQSAQVGILIFKAMINLLIQH